MEQWIDQGIVIGVRPHGESGAVVSLLTEEHGRHVGYVRGAKSSRNRGVLEPGSLVHARWQAQTSDQLGSFSLEPEKQVAASLMNDPVLLGALLSSCGLCDDALPEREPHSGLFHGLAALLEMLDSDSWGAAYVIWEIALLRELGFAIDLSRCAGGGDPARLAYVSPKSGCAVSLDAGEPYKEKLLHLPLFLRTEGGGINDTEILKGLEMTLYFLENWVFAHHSRGIPEDRLRFQARFAKYVEQENSEIDKTSETEEIKAHVTG